MDKEWYFNTFGDLIYVSNIHSYDLYYMNRCCCEAFGITDDSYKGQKCYKVLQGLDEPCSFCNNNLLSRDSTYTWEHTNKLCNRYFSIKDKLVDWDGHEARIEIATDITEYKEQVIDAELKMHSMMKSVPGGICRVSADGSFNIIWYNDHFLKLIGYTKAQFQSELCGKAVYVHPEDLPRAMEAMDTARKTGQPVVIEMRIVRRNGAVLTLMTTLSYAPPRGDVGPTFYSVGIDITDSKREMESSTRALEAALRAAQQASASKSQFLSRMSHEIRTPLNAVIGMTTIAGLSLDNRDALRDCLQKIESSANYLLSLINDILDMARIESGKLELARQSFSLPVFMAEVTALFAIEAHNKGIAFSATAAPHLPERFWGDPLRLKQILVNLLSNALKFTNTGGSASLHVRQLSQEASVIWLEFSVADTGIGIGKEAKERIFNTFEQEHTTISALYGGSGLGLSICRHIATLMGGTIAVRDNRGGGSLFVVTVPLQVDTERNAFGMSGVHCEASGTEADRRPAMFDGKRLLVVEDNELNLEVVTVLLEDRGFIVESAADGQQALDQFASHPPQYFDAILMDICMPVMDGLTAASLLRALPRSDASTVPIIALSANAFDDDIRRCLACGMNGHASKPLDIDVLCNLLATHCGGTSA